MDRDLQNSAHVRTPTEHINHHGLVFPWRIGQKKKIPSRCTSAYTTGRNLKRFWWSRFDAIECFIRKCCTSFVVTCDTCLLIIWDKKKNDGGSHFYPTQIEVKISSNKFKFPNPEIPPKSMPIISSLVSGFWKKSFVVTCDIYKCQELHFKKINIMTWPGFVNIWRNPCPRSNSFFTARCADDMQSIGTETTDISSVACVLLISATFRTLLDHCAPGGDHKCQWVKPFWQDQTLISIILESKTIRLI